MCLDPQTQKSALEVIAELRARVAELEAVNKHLNSLYENSMCIANVAKTALFRTGVRVAELEQFITKDERNLISELLEEIKLLRKALKPFAHLDLSQSVGGCVRDQSIVYQKNDAVLYLSDFRFAREVLSLDNPK